MSIHAKSGNGVGMTLPRLRVLLDAYGAAPAHWPQAERAAAEALIDSSPEARAMLAEATQLDALLDLAHAPAPSVAVAERIRRRRFGWRGLSAVLWGERFAGRTRRWMVSPRHQLAAVCGALALGVLLGVGIPEGGTGEGASVGTAPARSVAGAASHPGGIAIEQGRRSGSWIATASAQAFSSNADPAFDAPDPFGAAAHGMDLVDGARINGIPVPQAGEPFGSIPLL